MNKTMCGALLDDASGKLRTISRCVRPELAKEAQSIEDAINKLQYRINTLCSENDVSKPAVDNSKY